MNVSDILSSFSAFDLRRLVKAKRLHALREAAAQRVDALTDRLAEAEAVVEKLGRRLAKLLRNGRTRNGHVAKRGGAGRGAKRASRPAAKRPPRKGSLRSYLIAAIKSGGAAPARELAGRALKAGYKTKSKPDVFLRAVHLAISHAPEIARKNGKYGLK